MIIWLRHGQSTWNAAGKLQGHTEHPPLTPLGIDQANAAAEQLTKLPIDLIISSPAVRAQQTAAVVSARLGLPFRVDPRVIEQGLNEPAVHVEQRTAAAVADLPKEANTLVVSHGDVIALVVSRVSGQPHQIPKNGEWLIVR